MGKPVMFSCRTAALILSVVIARQQPSFADSQNDGEILSRPLVMLVDEFMTGYFKGKANWSFVRSQTSLANAETNLAWQKLFRNARVKQEARLIKIHADPLDSYLREFHDGYIRGQVDSFNEDKLIEDPTIADWKVQKIDEHDMETALFDESERLRLNAEESTTLLRSVKASIQSDDATASKSAN